jgi:CheY-like chemotaxis protein
LPNRRILHGSSARTPHIVASRRAKTRPTASISLRSSVSSSKEDIDLKECYKLSVNSYIAKPVTFDEFTKVVAEIGLYWLLVNRLPDP